MFSSFVGFDDRYSPRLRITHRRCCLWGKRHASGGVRARLLKFLPSLCSCTSRIQDKDFTHHESPPDANKALWTGCSDTLVSDTNVLWKARSETPRGPENVDSREWKLINGFTSHLRITPPPPNKKNKTKTMTHYEQRCTENFLSLNYKDLIFIKKCITTIMLHWTESSVKVRARARERACSFFVH